jgi:thiamine biosynthesis protein ThiC
VFGGLGAGVGALIGGAIAASHRTDHLLYVTPARHVTVMPIITPHRAQVSIALRLP